MDKQWLLIAALSLTVLLMVAGGVVRRRKGRKTAGWAMTCFGLGLALALLGTAAFLPHVNGEARYAELSARTVFTGIGCAGLGLMLAGLYLAFKPS